MKVEIWSDVVCPWCYIGKRRFERALAEFPHRDQVKVRWRSFELNPSAPVSSELPVPEMLQRQHGLSAAQVDEMFARVTALAAEEGLAYRLAEARQTNSFPLHRLLHLAASQGVADEVLESLMHAQHCAAADLSDRSVLLSVVAEHLTGAAELLDGTAYTAEVRADEQEARELGINGVPAFVLADRYLVSGAQPVEAFTAALTQAWREAA